MDLRLFVRSSCMVGAMLALAGCGVVDTTRIDTTQIETGGEQYEYLYDERRRNPLLPDEGRLFGGDNSLLDRFRAGADENRLPVNKYLWRASLDTLSFMPLSSIDTFSGVIATDWTADPNTANERVRVTTYVRDAELSATALDVSVFREVLSPTGAWQSASVDPAVAVQLEDAILTRARQLRIEDIDG